MPIMLALFFIFMGFAGGVAAGFFLAKKDFEDRFDEIERRYYGEDNKGFKRKER